MPGFYGVLTTNDKLSETRRFLMLVVGSFGCVSVSLSFGFNIFSGDMQKMYNLTQADMSIISTVGIVSAYFCIPHAFVYDYFGIVPVLFLGLFLITIGALLMGLAFAGVITPSMLNLCAFNGIYNFATGLYDVACIVSVLGLFPLNKGAVVAVMKTYIGLGSAIIGAIQLAFFQGAPAHYFFFLMALGFTIGLLNLLFLRQAPYVLSEYEEHSLTKEEISKRFATKSIFLGQKPPSLRFALGVLNVVLLIVLTPLQSVLVANMNLSSTYRIAFTCTVIFVWLSLFLVAAPFKFLNRSWRFWQREEKQGNADFLCQEDSSCNAGKCLNHAEIDYVPPQYQTTFFQSLCTLKLWAIFWSLFCTLGTGLVILTNSRFIFNALAGEVIDDSFNTLLTVLNGVGSAVGRLLMGFFETWLQRKKPEDRISITFFFFIPTITVFLMQLLFLTIDKKEWLPIPYVIGAFANGVTAIVIVVVMNTIYAKHPGLHYNFCFLSTTVAYVLFNRYLYGEWYTREAEKRGTIVCLDRECVRMPMLVMLGLNLSALISNAYVHWEYTKMSCKTFAERRQLVEQQTETEPQEVF